MDHNFLRESPTDLRTTPLSYIFNALFRNTPRSFYEIKIGKLKFGLSKHGHQRLSCFLSTREKVFRDTLLAPHFGIIFHHIVITSVVILIFLILHHRQSRSSSLRTHACHDIIINPMLIVMSEPTLISSISNRQSRSWRPRFEVMCKQLLGEE